MTRKRTALATALAMCLSGAGLADERRLDGIVAFPGDAPGCALAVHRDGARTLLAASGLADIERGIPIGGGTRFYAASVSKQFTALAVVQLAERGALALDDDIRTHIPELPAYRSTVTVRMLLQHSAGLRDSLALLRLGGYDAPGAATMAQALELQLAQRDTNFVPGTATGYSNGGYLLLAELVQRVSGEPFAAYLRRHILEPLGMSDSFVLDGAPPPAGRVAHGYVRNDAGFERRDTYPRFGGSGGLMLTLDDLARYEHDIERGHRVWTPAVRRAMTEAGTLADGAPALRDDTGLTYAAGLMLGTRLGHAVVQHGGSAEAFRHLYVRLPGHRLGIAVFCNRGDQPVQEMVDEAIDLLAGPAPGHAAEGPEPGRYRSDELRADYRVERSGRELKLAIVRDGVPDAPLARTLRRSAPGRYEGDGIVLRQDAGETGFILETARARGIAVRRVAAPGD